MSEKLHAEVLTSAGHQNYIILPDCETATIKKKDCLLYRVCSNRLTQDMIVATWQPRLSCFEVRHTELPRLAAGRAAVTNEHSHRIICWHLSLRLFSWPQRKNFTPEALNSECSCHEPDSNLKKIFTSSPVRAKCLHSNAKIQQSLWSRRLVGPRVRVRGRLSGPGPRRYNFSGAQLRLAHLAMPRAGCRGGGLGRGTGTSKAFKPESSLHSTRL